MLLTVRIPTSMPKMSMPLSMSDVDFTLAVLPSASTILLSLVAACILTSFVRALVIGLREHLALVRQKRQQHAHPVPAQAIAAQVEKAAASAAAPARPPRRPLAAWVWGLVRWESLLSRRSGGAATPGEQTSFINEKQGWSSPQTSPRRPPLMSQVGRRSGPAFSRPLPTLYESDIPVSMAKMIMSRHTFRRPSSRPPPARSTNTVQIQRKAPLLPPQASSSLARPPSPPSRSPSPSPPSSPSSSRSNSRSPSPPRRLSRSPPPAAPTDLPAEGTLRASGSIV